MQNRKSFIADLENKKGLFLQIGLVLALASVWTAFEWKTYKDGPGSLGDMEMVIDDEEVLVTQRNTPPPPPPPPAPPEVLNIVDDEKVDIEELTMESTEIDNDDMFELLEVDVNQDEVFTTGEDGFVFYVYKVEYLVLVNVDLDEFKHVVVVNFRRLHGQFFNVYFFIINDVQHFGRCGGRRGRWWCIALSDKYFFVVNHHFHIA